MIIHVFFKIYYYYFIILILNIYSACLKHNQTWAAWPWIWPCSFTSALIIDSPNNVNDNNNDYNSRSADR